MKRSKLVTCIKSSSQTTIVLRGKMADALKGLVDAYMNSMYEDPEEYDQDKLIAEIGLQVGLLTEEET